MIATTNAKNHSNEIISISGLIHNDVHLDKGAPDKEFKNSFCCKFISLEIDNVIMHLFLYFIYFTYFYLKIIIVKCIRASEDGFTLVF